MENALILLVSLSVGFVLLLPRLARARTWRATITPLASIIGSGFLVLGPILDASYGAFAPLVMAGLCVLAYAFGNAIRFNIAALGDRAVARPVREERLEITASWALSGAYVVSVAYYLNLFGAFAVSLTPFDTDLAARLVTSGIFGLILITGWTRGFAALERMEQVSVGLKLAVIAGLLVGLGVFFAQAAGAGALRLNPMTLSGWNALTLAFGLIVTVQGFETSRYLGASYDAATRVRSMRFAQLLSGGIYMLYALLLAYVFAPDATELSETAIIDMMRIVAPVLPGMLLVAALSAQFSAAVADTGGAGGLIAELSAQRLSVRQAYGLIVAGGLALTWSADVFQIISTASRAFAVYYALQCAIAALMARRLGRSMLRVWAYAVLAGLGAVIAVFGAAVA